MDASARGLPVSDCRTSMMCSALSSTQPWNFNNQGLRPFGPRASHSGWNSLSSRAFAATVSAESFGTSPTTLPSAGLRTSMVVTCGCTCRSVMRQASAQTDEPIR